MRRINERLVLEDHDIIQGYEVRGDRVVDVRSRRRRPNHQVLEVAPGRIGDGRRQLAGVKVDVLAIARRNRQRPRGVAVGDRDHALVGRDHRVAMRDVRQRRREHVVRDPAFQHRRGAQVHRGRIDRVVDRHRRRVSRVQRFIIATGRAGDRDAVALVIDIGIVALHRERRRGARGMAIEDRDRRAVAQGQHEVAALRRMVHAGRDRRRADALVHRHIVQRHRGRVAVVGDHERYRRCRGIPVTIGYGVREICRTAGFIDVIGLSNELIGTVSGDLETAMGDRDGLRIPVVAKRQGHPIDMGDGRTVGARIEIELPRDGSRSL